MNNSEQTSQGENVYVQYGCWKDAPQEWHNYDCSPYLVLDRFPLVGRHLTKILRKNDVSSFPENIKYGDIVKGLPHDDQSCKGVYCSHVLEHLSLQDFRIALAETKRIIMVGGIFRFVLPDLNYYINKYMLDDSVDAAIEFMTDTGLGELKRIKGIKGIGVSIFGNSRHRWMWDYPSIEKELLAVGFGEIRKAEFNDSIDPQFIQVERKERWENCLGVECRRKN